MKIKHFCLALGLTTIGSAASIFSPIATLPAKALTWTLSDVTFDDGGVATGSFDYNAANNIYSNINVSITGPVYQGGTTNFTSSNSTSPSGNGANSGSNALLVCQGTSCFQGNPAYFWLNFSSPLNDTRETINLWYTEYGFVDEFGANTSGATGSVTSTAVPFEFNSGQGIALGLPLFIGLRMLKKRRALKKSTREVQEMIRSRVNLS